MGWASCGHQRLLAIEQLLAPLGPQRRDALFDQLKAGAFGLDLGAQRGRLLRAMIGQPALPFAPADGNVRARVVPHQPRSSAVAVSGTPKMPAVRNFLFVWYRTDIFSKI